jgi:polar amino acid transport system substrate-binding protein
MKKLKSIFAVIFASSCVISISAQNKIIIAVDEENPPFMYRDSTSDAAAGLYPVLINAVFEKAGIPVTVKPFPWKRVLSMGENGEAGIGGIYKNAKRLEIFDYSDQLFVERLVIYTRKGEPVNYTGINSLKGKKVAIIRGWSYGDDFDKGKTSGLFSVDEAQSDEIGFQKMLTYKNVDCVVAVEESGEKILSRLGIKDKVQKEKTPLAESPTFVVFAKKANRQTDIRSFNKALKDMKADGSYQTVIRNAFK